jgi:tetratricopeptide (TPR) repeat protein
MKKFLLPVSLVLALAAAGLAQKQPHAKSNEEAKALNDVFQATNVDVQIAAADAVLEKYADTEFKSTLLQMIAADYQRKNDFPKTIVYGDRALEADPQNYEAMLVLGNEYAKITKENDLDRDEKLGKAEGYANKVLAIVPTAAKPNPRMTDAEWADAQKDLQSSAHEILGIAALTRKKLDVAITEFKKSVDMAATPDPATYVRLAVAYNMAGKYDDAIAITEKVATLPNAVPQVKSVAQAEHVRAVQAKKKAEAASAPPAATAAPATPAPATPPNQ